MDYFGVYKDLLRMATKAAIHLVYRKGSKAGMFFVDECAKFREELRGRECVTPLQVECAVIETETFFQR